MQAPMVKLYYKTLNEGVVLVILIIYSLLGQTYKSKSFDFAFYGAIWFMLMNNMRSTFFFLFTDKANLDKNTVVQSTWACMRFRRGWKEALVNLLQYISLIANIATRQTFISLTPDYAIVPTLNYEHSKTTDASYLFAEPEHVQFWNLDESKLKNNTDWITDSKDMQSNYFDYAEKLYATNGNNYDATVQRAPRLYNIQSYMLYFIFHPNDVNAKKKMSQDQWSTKDCSGVYSAEFGYEECCWSPERLAQVTGDARTSNSVADWLGQTADAGTPACFFPNIATLGYGNMVLTNITMLVATVLFLRNFRLTRLGAMINSIVACLKEFFWWCLVALVFVIPFAVLQFNLFFPNSLLKSVDDGHDCSGLQAILLINSNNNLGDTCKELDNKLYNKPDILKNLFKMTTFNVFGEMFFGFFDPEEHQPWTCDPVTMRDGGGPCQDYVSVLNKLFFVFLCL